MATKDNLAAAFAGESQANRRYLAFAQQAERDGYSQVSKLFKAAAAAETVHALGHLKAMGGIQGTEENIQTAIEGEHHEYTSMYPEFRREAVDENEKRAAVMFRYALAVEEIHHDLYQAAMEAVKAGNDLEEQPIHGCSVCGNTFVGEVPEICPVCNTGKDKFHAVE